MSSTTRTRDSTAPTHDYGDADRFLDANGEHPLWTDFTFWMFSKRDAYAKPATKDIDIDSLFSEPTKGDIVEKTPKTEYETYLDHFAKMGPFRTIEGFWKLYSYIKRPSAGLDFTYHCFRGNIHPTWDHPANANGGKWVIKLRRSYGPRLFEVVLLSMIGNEYNLGDELTGVVLNFKKQEDILSVWVSTQDPSSIHRLNQVVKRWIHACYYTIAPGVAGTPTQPVPNQTQQPPPPPVITAIDFVPHHSPNEHTKASTGTPNQSNQNRDKDDDNYTQPQTTSNTQQPLRHSKFTSHSSQTNTGFVNRNGGGYQNGPSNNNNNNNNFTRANSSRFNSSVNNNNDTFGATERLQPKGDQGAQSLISTTSGDDDFKVMTFDDDYQQPSPQQALPQTSTDGNTQGNQSKENGTVKKVEEGDSDKGFVAAAVKTRPVDTKKTNRAAAKLAEKQAAAAASAAAAKKNPFADLDD